MTITSIRYTLLQTLYRTISVLFTIALINPYTGKGLNDHHHHDLQYDHQANHEPDHASKLPNVVFILADDYGFNDVGYHGRQQGSVIETPNLDRLAGEGVKLENYYVQPICTPTRSQLMSGRYQIHTGLQHSIIRPPQPNCLPVDEVTIPQKLRERGYATHMVGKWHLGFYKDACLPTERGFDSFFGYLVGSEDYFTHMRSYWVEREVFRGYDLHANKTPAEQYRGRYSTNVFTEKAINAINDHDKSKPLFLYLAYQAVHGPLEVPKQYKKPYANITSSARQNYAGMVSCMDEGIGNVTAALEKAGLYNNTIIIFSTDNGGPIDAGANNWPLRGSKATLWEGGVRGVGFVHSPLLPSAVRGTINRDLLHVSDWLPTIVAGIARGKLNGTKPLDGFNIWNSIIGVAPSPRRELLHNIDPLCVAPYSYGQGVKDPDNVWTQDLSIQLRSVPCYQNFTLSMRAALRVGDWKIQTGLGGSYKDVSRKSKYDVWKPPPESGLGTVYPIKKPNQKVWLFNISADPLEQADVSADYPEVINQLLNRLNEYYQDSVPVRYPDPDMNADPALHGGVWGPWT